MNELDLLARIDDFQHNSLKIPYHQLCKTDFISKHKKMNQTKNSDWHRRRENHARARDQLNYFIQENIIQNMHIYQFSYILNIFRQFLMEQYCTELPKSFETGNLEKEIKAHFGDEIKIFQNYGRKYVVSSTATLTNVNMKWVNDETTIKSAALLLRRIVLNIEKHKIDCDVNVSKLIEGECEIPDILIEFFAILLTGGNIDKIKNPRTVLKAKSFASDVVSAVHRGQVKTSKHITLGMTLKSLTNSEKIVRLLHSYGHCISYTATLELETEATYSLLNAKRVCPAEMVLRPELNSGFAFDNLDRYVETSTGNNTMHDTVGIAFQDVISDLELEALNNTVPIVNGDDVIDSDIDDNNESDTHEPSEVVPAKKMRRSLHCDSLVLSEVTVNLKYLGTIQISEELNVPNNLPEIKQLDRIWMICHAFQIPTPMWVGFNVKIITDRTKKQKVFYLPPINDSPTKNPVVYETMKRTIKASKECGQSYAECHYDLAITSKALKIQNTLFRTYNDEQILRLFIHVAPFHVQMSGFKAVGKFIEDCGITQIMVDAGLLASGSVSSFLTGKHFNRCKRLHPLIAVTIEILHFEFFLQNEVITLSPQCFQFLKNFQNNKNAGASDSLISYKSVDNAELLHLLSRYETFRQKTLNGDHGKTPKFYLTYVEMINNFLIFDRSIRTGDLDLYKHILPSLTNLCFVFNHQNYARYLVLYLQNLQKVHETHPGLKINIGVKRTDRPFSRRPVDFTLETTINADAARFKKGFSNSVSVRARWAKSHSVRTEITSHVLSEAFLKSVDEVTSDLKLSNIKRSSSQIENLKKCITERLSPFSSLAKNNVLYNINTGQSASESTEKFLLQVNNLGDEQRINFIEECSNDPTRFSKPIKKNVLNTFKIKSVKKVKNGKVEEFKIHRDLFGRLLGISLKCELEIEKALEYPLTPVPLSLCHLDGSINKTDKSKLVQPLLNREFSDEIVPNTLDAVIIDGFFYLYTLYEFPETFGGISHNILKNLTNIKAQQIHIIFDTYPQPSIKDHEHKLRENLREKEFVIDGPGTKRPANFLDEMKSIKFKQAFVEFLIKDWSSPVHNSLIKPTQTIFLNYDKCYKYRKVADEIRREEAEELSCDHEEADTKIVFHACSMRPDTKILIKCSDTDILVIMLANLKHLLDTEVVDRKIWVQLGTGNNIRNIDVCSLFITLGEKLCSSLAAFHALTGCDYNPSFNRKAKLKPFKLLESSPKFQEAFIQLGDPAIITNPELLESTLKIMEEFVCCMYNVKAVKTVNEARLVVFDRKYRPKNEKERFRKSTAKLEASAFPPSSCELEQHVRRTIYIAQIWCNSNLKTTTTIDPEDYGWKIIDGKYEFHWFDGEECPSTVMDVVRKDEKAIEESDDEKEEDEDSDEDEREDDNDNNENENGTKNYFLVLTYIC